MVIRVRGKVKDKDDGRAGLCETLAGQEQVRKEVASMLHSNVQSRLSACNVWLAKAERLLLPDAGSGPAKTPRGKSDDGVVRGVAFAEGMPASGLFVNGTSDGEMDDAEELDMVARIMEALALLHKVRAEVEQLRKEDVQRAVRRLYPTLISLGLRPALETLYHDVFQTDELEDETRSPAVEWHFTDEFRTWDRPDGDDGTVSARLELYRLTEGVLRALRAAQEMLTVGEGHGDGATLFLRIAFDVRDDAVHVSVRCGLGVEGPMPGHVMKFLSRSLPVRRFRAGGGTMLIGSDARGRFRVAASLPVRVSAGE